MELMPAYRYLVLCAAVLLQLCLGATYSWAVFVEPLRGLFQLGQGRVQLPFSIFYVVFPLTMVGAGQLAERWGVRRSALLGAALFAGGWLTAGLAGARLGFSAVAVGIGLLGGVGAGVAYVVPIWAAVQWFPEHKGLVTGVAVAGFGGGAALVSQAARTLMAGGTGALTVFTLAGLSFLILAGASALVFRLPPGLSPPPREGTWAVLREGPFRLLYLAMFAGLCAGFAVNANLKQIYPDATLLSGAVAVSLFAVFNAAGRIVWGFLHDRRPGPLFVQANLLAQMLVLVLGVVGLRSDALYYLFAGLAGFNYGGVLVLYAAEVGRRWGAARLARVYGLLFSSNAPAALSPVLVGFAFDRTGGFGWGFSTVSVLLVVAALALQLTGRANEE
jgi:OFA family oxalate/formate antiporter-like MFS transporter